MSVSGMKILVTGASSGIGAHLARYLAGQGAELVVAARRVDRLEAMAAESAERITALGMDVGDADSVREGVVEAAERMGGLDGLFNNAGIEWGGRTLEMTREDWDRVIDINVNGAFHVANTAAKIMAKQRQGAIVSTASILGFGTGKGVTAYATSKAAVVHMTRNMAQEWARYGVRVNAIAPGYFPTEMTEPYLSSERGQEMLKAVPMRRAGKLEELEGPIELLLGSRGSFITGVTLPVDGGHLCHPL